ncbi:adenine nucleotide alpha hydrolase [Nocardia asteroides]|uniref:adenine nucleotide alpha hydrolase n=1 Tax=Nocardia asteroides TaxID=1824 RepID=UPI0037CB8283
MSDRINALVQRLDEIGPLAVAVSGGVDSITLATVAHKFSRHPVEIFHAVSPAVPADATARTHRHADAQGWDLRVIDAEEFQDDDYLSNPVNRCLFCKTHLYSAIADRTQASLISGTNVDDMGDFRPGLSAAARFGVLHPYVDVGIDKDGVREIARELALTDIADLPASPCLASRVETGIRVTAAMLPVIDQVEHELREMLNPEVVRCRVRATGISVELDQKTLDGMSANLREDVHNRVLRLWSGHSEAHAVELLPYHRGSAFLHSPTLPITTKESATR